MNGRAIPGAYLFRLYVCDKEMSWHHIGETHQPKKVSDKPKGSRKLLTFRLRFRLTNVIPERIIFVSRGITVYIFVTLDQIHPFLSARYLNDVIRSVCYGECTWALWWTKWHWERLFSEYFGFPLQYNSTSALYSFSHPSLMLCSLSSWQCC
jgi:hypothetical protein